MSRFYCPEPPAEEEFPEEDLGDAIELELEDFDNEDSHED